MKHTTETSRGRLAPLARDMMQGGVRFALVLYGFAAVVDRLAPRMADYFTALHYRDAALETAPALLAAGIVAGLITDLALRRGER